MMSCLPLSLELLTAHRTDPDVAEAGLTFLRSLAYNPDNALRLQTTIPLVVTVMQAHALDAPDVTKVQNMGF